MIDLYPFLMRPVFDLRPWGAHDLSPIYPNHRFEGRIGEAWLTGPDCKVANGPLAGKSLSELSAQYGRELVGTASADPSRFPLLLKFLFPQEKLSVQVHPDDAGARDVGEPCGKTECWYIAHAKPGSQIALGLKPGVTREQFEHSVRDNHAEELLNWINVYPGEMIYVAGGTVHTLGPGAIVVETQQQSDTTYRLYDYGRPRELHLERGMKVIKENNRSGKVIRAAPSEIGSSRNRRSPLVAAPYFTVDRLELIEPYTQNHVPGGRKSSPQILVAIEGCGVIEVAGKEPVTLAKGDAVVIPASIDKWSVQPQWTIELLKSFVPGEPVAEPATRM